MKTLLLTVLEELLTTVNSNEGDNKSESLTLIRCIIRLVVKLMAEPGAKLDVLVPTLLRHFISATKNIETLHTHKRATAAVKDISWLWRTAYNCAVQGSSEWEDLEEEVSRLFDTTRMLLEVYCEAVLTDVDAEIFAHVINASFAAVAGRMFALRRQLVARQTPQGVQLSAIKEQIKETKTRIQRIISKNQLPGQEETERAQSFIHVLRVFEVEILCLMKEWKELLSSVEVRHTLSGKRADLTR